MTKKQKLRRNGFAADFNAKEDDFILADLDAKLDKEELSPVPLNHFLDDEETIDRLLINSGFDANDELDEDDRGSVTLVTDDLELSDDFSSFDQFAIEPIEEADQNLLTETEGISALDIHSRADFDAIQEEDAIDRLLVDAGFDANDEQEYRDKKPGALEINDINLADEFGVNFEEQNVMAVDASIFDSDESELALDKEEPNVFLVKEENSETTKQEQAISGTTYPDKALEGVNNEAGITALSSVRSEQENIKKQIKDYENKIKKAAIITYISLSFGIVALLSTVVIGVIVSSAQTKVSKLTELVSIIEEDLTIIAGKNSDMEIDNSDSSIEQLNQKVTGIPKQSEEKTRLSSGMLGSEMRAIVVKQATINKSPDNPQVNVPVLEKKKSSEATVKQVSAEKKVQVQNQLIKQSQSSVDVSKNKMTTVATKSTSVNKSNDKLQSKTPVLEKKKPSEAVVKKASAERKANNTQAAAGWSVILTAYKDQRYAESKAAKLIQKGIPVKVIAVKMNNTTWYRLKVGGFKNKEKATSYAAKIKKSLDLNTVTIGNT